MRLDLMALLLPMFAAAQVPVGQGAVRGFARDSAGRAVRGVMIGSAGIHSVARTNDSGSYLLEGMVPGKYVLTARHLGFAPETAAVVIRGGVIAVADFSMKAVVVSLEGEVVTADPLRGKMGPFNRRRSRGVGSFISRREIEERQAASVSELLRYLPGVSVTQAMAGEPQPVRMDRIARGPGTEDCKTQIYVDGHPYTNGNLDDFSPSSLEGVEVYRSASEIPADFRTRGAMCGVIVLWTRDPDAARKKP